MTNSEVPNYEDIAVATLKALVNMGGSGSNQEIGDEVAGILELSDEVLEVPHGGGRTEFLYRAAWARTILKHMSAVENSGRAVWSITEEGRHLAVLEDSVREQFRETRQRVSRQSREKAAAPSATATVEEKAVAPGTPAEGDGEHDDEWRGRLLSILQGMPPAAFERLCQRVLRESGFTKVEVTGQSGDGGIDGVGVLRLELISFSIVFQCKRYSGSVGASLIREFRGSMAGRADKGLFITTGHFTRDAQREAVRDGAVAIDLIDGEGMCDLLKARELGLHTQMVEQVTVDQDFFQKI